MAKSLLRLDSMTRDSFRTNRDIFQHSRQCKSHSVKAKCPVYRIQKPFGGYEPICVNLAPLFDSKYTYKETPPVQATDLDGPSSLLAESRFVKELQNLPYAFCTPTRLSHIPTYRYPQYRDEPSRLRTFAQHWCHDLDPRRFAAAGFFYTENGRKEATRDLVLNNSLDVPMRYKFRCPRGCVVDITEGVGTIPAKGDASVTFKFVPKAKPVEPRHDIQLKMVPLLHTPSKNQDPFVVFKDHVISDIVHIEFEEEMNKEMMTQIFTTAPKRDRPKLWWQK